ncbi:MAG: serine/threonine-protein phosphatase [Oscillospiraceae bacterium]|nr:serine/threonine-protein phosphatase [Oscillospiraceae bacterium]
MLTISSSGTSNAGQKNVNEDNFYMNGIFIAEGNARSGGLYSDTKQRKIQFYAVFDGIGEEVESAVNPNITFYNGQNSSFLAAHMMSKLQQHIVKLRKSERPYNLNDTVYRYVQKTNEKLFINMQKKGVRSGTSFAFLCIDGLQICAYNIGNCKIFILREDRLNLLTKNDTKVEELIYSNRISQDIARFTPENKVLTQYLGLYPNEKQANLHINSKLIMRPGDKFLLCSDGLCDAVSDSRMLEIMRKDISEQEIIRELTQEAEQNGARENVTAVVVGANVSENSAKAKNLRGNNPNLKFNFKPLSFRTKFGKLSPKMIKTLAVYIICAVLGILLIVFTVSGLIRFIVPDTPSVPDITTPEVTVFIPPTDSPRPSVTERPTVEGINIPTHDFAEEPEEPDDLDETAETTTAAVTTAQPLTAAPTQPPQTQPPEPEPPEETDEETEGETEETEETAAPEPEDITEPVTEPPEETQPPETEPPEETQPPETEAPEIPDVPEVTEEPTIAAETFEE